jgi:hypothetical protein
MEGEDQHTESYDWRSRLWSAFYKIFKDLGYSRHFARTLAHRAMKIFLSLIEEEKKGAEER